MHAHTRDLPGGVQAWYVRLTINVGLDSAHLVVHSGSDGNRFFPYVHVCEVPGNFQNLRQPLAYDLLSQMAAVQQDGPVYSTTFVNLGLL